MYAVCLKRDVVNQLYKASAFSHFTWSWSISN